MPSKTSSDGRYYWDEQRNDWVSVNSSWNPNGGFGNGFGRGFGRGMGGCLGFVAGGGLLLWLGLSSCGTVAQSVGQSLQQAVQTAEASASASGPGGYGYPDTTCAGACVDYDNMTLTAINQARGPKLTADPDQPFPGMTISADYVTPGAQWVQVWVTIANSPDATEQQVVTSDDFNIVGSNGQVVGNQYGEGGCEDWSITLAQTGGTTGSQVLCFPVTGDIHAAMTLQWDPRVLGMPVTVPLAAG